MQRGNFIRIGIAFLALVAVVACAEKTRVLQAPVIDNAASVRSTKLYRELNHVQFVDLYAEYANAGTDEFHRVPVGDYVAHALVRRLSPHDAVSITLEGFSLKCRNEGGFGPHAICEGKIEAVVAYSSGEPRLHQSAISNFDAGSLFVASSDQFIAEQIKAVIDLLAVRL